MSPSECVSKTPNHEEVVPETPQEQLHSSPPYTVRVFRRVATGLPKLEMREVRYTKPVPGEKPASLSPIRLPNCSTNSSPYRVSTDDVLRFAGNNHEEIERNKYRYCVHKDELVVGIGRPW